MTKRYWHDLVDGSLVENIPLAELTTDPATDVTENSAILNGTIDGVEGTVSDEKESFFEYGEVGQGFPEQTGTNTTTQNTPFSYGRTISDLSQNTDYEFRAAVTVEGETFTGGTQTFTTESAIPDSVITQWQFEDDGDTTTATDAVGSNDGNINGASYSATAACGSFGIETDGTDDDVISQNTVDPTAVSSSGVAVAAFFQPSKTGAFQYICGWGNTESSRFGISINDNDQWRAFANFDGAFDTATGPAIDTNNYQHVLAYVASNGEIGVIVDGTLEATTATSQDLSAMGAVPLVHGYQDTGHYGGFGDNVSFLDDAAGESTAQELINQC